MPLNPIKAGLRTLHYDSNQVGKLDIRVQPGDEIHVPDALADALIAADSHFREGPAPEAAEVAAETDAPKRRGRPPKS